MKELLVKIYCIVSLCIGVIGLFILTSMSIAEKNPALTILFAAGMIGLLLTLVFGKIIVDDDEGNKPESSAA